MSTQLKDFINANKSEFNREEPSHKLWERIEAELDKVDAAEAKPVTKFIWSRWMSVAAMALVVLTVAITIGISKKMALNNESESGNSFKDQQVHFTSLIEEKRDSLQIYSHKNPELYQQFVSDLKRLDEDYIKLQEQLKTSPNQEVVVQAMIKNLEIRANILSQQLQVFHQVNEVKQEKIL